jgi:hypothetical protein
MRTSWRFWFLLLLMALLASGIGYGLKSLRAPAPDGGAQARHPAETAALPVAAMTNDDA